MTASLSVAEEPAENPAFECGRREEVESSIYLGYAGGDIDVDGESVERVAAPFERLAIGFEEQACEIDDRTIGRVLAGNPLRIIEGEVAGSGGNFQRGVKDFAGSRSGVDRDGDGGRGGWRCCKRRN